MNEKEQSLSDCLIKKVVIDQLKPTGRTRMNYIQKIHMTEAFTKKNFLDTSEEAFSQIMDLISVGRSIIDPNKNISYTSADSYRKIIVSIWKKVYIYLMDENNRAEHDEYVEKYGHPFAYNVRPLENINKMCKLKETQNSVKEINLPNEEALSLFYQEINKRDSFFSYVVDCIGIVGLTPTETCELQIQDIHAARVSYIELLDENKDVVKRVPIPNALRNQLAMAYMERQSNRKREIKKEYVFINDAGNQLNLKGISTYIKSIRDKIMMKNPENSTIKNISTESLWYLAMMELEKNLNGEKEYKGQAIDFNIVLPPYQYMRMDRWHQK